MNFKEVYKSANDNIKGDRTLIDKVYERAEKRHNNFFAPSFAAAVVAFALILYPTISTHHTKMPSGNETANSSAKGKRGNGANTDCRNSGCGYDGNGENGGRRSKRGHSGYE